MMTLADRLLTASEAARILRLAPRRIEQMASRGEMPSVRLPNGETRYDADDLARWIDAHRQPAREARTQ